MAERVVWGMPVSAESWFWLSSRSSRRMRTDSPTETEIRFFGGDILSPKPPLIVRGNGLDRSAFQGHFNFFFSFLYIGGQTIQILPVDRAYPAPGLPLAGAPGPAEAAETRLPRRPLQII